MLHVTNGTSVSLGETGLGGEVLAWIDVLHEGPVPAGLTDEELGRLRGLFLGSEAALVERDRILASHDDVTLWFEHDLYDQLQLIQILERLKGSRPRAGLTLICVERYLGMLSGAELAQLWPLRRPVEDAELELAADAWAAFRSPDPMDVEALRATAMPALPFLGDALRRHLQQFPAVENGLSRTERQILEALENRQLSFRALFAADREREERIFMGDTSLMRYVDGLCSCRSPLIREEGGEYWITDTGREVLAGRADQVRLNGINRWLGGVHLVGNEALWRWDERAGGLRRS